MRLSPIRSALGIITLVTLNSVPAGAQQQPRVSLIAGSIEQPAKLRENDRVAPGKTVISTRARALVILTYSWRSDQKPYPCVRWVIIGGEQTFPVAKEATPGRCDLLVAGDELDAVGSDSVFVRKVTFYGTLASSEDPKADAGGKRPAKETRADRDKIHQLQQLMRDIRDRQ